MSVHCCLLSAVLLLVLALLPCPGGASASLFQQAGGSTVSIQETPCREQVTGSCRGFGVFAAAADKAGHGRGHPALYVSRARQHAWRSSNYVVGHRRPCRGLGGHTWRGIPCVASGMGLLFASDDARPAQRPSRAHRNGLGGAGLISTLFLKSGLP